MPRLVPAQPEPVLGRSQQGVAEPLRSKLGEERVLVNGLAFSPEGRILYHSDSYPTVRTVWAWDFDPADGRISNRRVFIDTHGMPGRPDGGCCDADGCYWMTGNDGWEILRLTPAGRVDRRIALPIAKPSMVAFGGRALDVLYITSIRPADVTAQPQAGSLFALRPGTRDLTPGKITTRLAGYAKVGRYECARLESEFEIATEKPSDRLLLRGRVLSFFALAERKFIRASAAVSTSSRGNVRNKDGIWITSSLDAVTTYRVSFLEPP